jgi:hypothetical protein
MATKKTTLANKYLNEYLKCSSSFDYFAQNYAYIEEPGGDVLLKPYQQQIELIDAILREKFILTLKSRQIGISTITKIFSAWLCTFNKNVVIGIVSKDGAEASDFARGIISILQKLPKWMAPTFVKKTERTFILSNGAKVFVSPVAPISPDKCLRGKPITFLIIDEAAFIDKIEDAWTALAPALSTSQKAARKNNIPYGTIILSTPNKTVGKGEWFYNQYQAALEGDAIFKQKTIYWGDIPELANDPLWYKNTCELLGNNPAKIQQELELKFLPAGGAFFDANTAMALQDSKTEPIEKMRIYNGEIWKFAEPNPESYYMVGVDIAPEHGHDHSAIVIFDYVTLEQVWEFRGKCKVNDLNKLVKLAIHNYPGILVIENNSYGNQVLEEMGMSEYAFAIYKHKHGHGKNLKHIPGVNTNPATRPLMIDALYDYVTEFPNSIKSQRLKMELIGLVKKKSTDKVMAEGNGYDDLALASAFCYYVRKWDPPKLISHNDQYRVTSTMKAIVDMNDNKDRRRFSNDGSEFNQFGVKKEIKEEIKKQGYVGGVVNVWDIMNLNLGNLENKNKIKKLP